MSPLSSHTIKYLSGVWGILEAMPFVVAPANRTRVPDSTDAVISFPVVVEDAGTGHVSGPVAHRDTREAAQKLADALNAALNKF